MNDAGHDLMKKKIATVEAQMKEKLTEVRVTLAQSVNKGISVEDVFRRFLREYLPPRLRLGQGEIIDRGGRRSAQTDVVIVSDDHPFTFTPDLPGLFLIEGVCAAAEVKTILTAVELQQALRSSSLFKKLEMGHLQGTLANANESDLKRFYRCPPWFLVAFESQMDLPTIEAKIKEFAEKESIQSDRVMDGVFVIDQGWLINFGDGKGAIKFETSDGKSVEGWVRKESSSVLFDLLSWLHGVMPRMIRMTPILAAYVLPGA